MSNPQSTASNVPTHGSTAGASAAESVKGTVHHIQGSQCLLVAISSCPAVPHPSHPSFHRPGMGDAIRGNTMDFVDTMFGTPRQSGEPRVGAARAGEGEDVTRGPGERATAGPDVARRTDDDPAARTSTANNAHDAQTRSSESQPATTGSTTEPGVAGKSGRPAEDAPTQGPPALPPRDA
ncbi:hypothetical protein V8D89_002633 [Ganoderma adspersum]